MTQLKHGVNNIPLSFFFELEEFDKFEYSNFVTSFSKYDLASLACNVKKYFEEVLEFDYHSYSLNTTVEAVNDSMEYGELIKLTATISIKKD